jgi:hypothetical protein
MAAVAEFEFMFDCNVGGVVPGMYCTGFVVYFITTGTRTRAKKNNSEGIRI